MMACQRNHISRSEHEIVLKYLDLIPSETAIYLEDSLRVPKIGWTPNLLMKAHDEYSELREVYSSPATGGGMNRNRATWNNDRKMMNTP